jgi:hypothetical protein
MWCKINLIILFLLGSKVYAQSPLCASRPTTFCCEYVSSVTINGRTFTGSKGFTSTSGGSPAGYYDYAYTKDTVPRITAGQNISISYTAVTNGNYMEYFKLWIDFNGNGVLTDAGELVHSSNYQWNGTKTVTATFTVPTSIYNGEVYMRFVMQYSGSPTICGTYPYGNTFDFKTRIVGATDPFSYSGYIYNSEEVGIQNIPVKFYSKLKSSSTYIYESSINTDINGKYNISSTKDATVYDFQIEISSLSISSPTVSDAQSFNQKVLSQTFNSRDYYRMDVNNDDYLSITDVYLVYAKIIGRTWKNSLPNYRIFTPTEWNFISTSSLNLKSSYSGVQTVTLSGVSNKGNSNYYLIRTGYRN